MAEHWYTIEHGPNDVDVADGTGSLIACELLPDRAALIAAAPETAAERDRLREVNADLKAQLDKAVDGEMQMHRRAVKLTEVLVALEGVFNEHASRSTALHCSRIIEKYGVWQNAAKAKATQ